METAATTTVGVTSLHGSDQRRVRRTARPIRARAALGALVVGLAAAISARAAAPVNYVEIDSIGAPGSASQMLYSSTHEKLVLRNGGSAIVLLDLADGSAQTFFSHTLFTDMSLSPSGRYVFVADYGHENIGYGTPQTPSYVGRLDLATGAWQTKSAGQAVAYRVEAVDDEHFILTSIDQWISFTYDRWGNGAAITVLSPTSSFSAGYWAGVYYGDIEYDRRSGRLLHGGSGSSSQEISAFRVSGNTFVHQEDSGTYGSANGQGGTSVLAVDGSALYYGALQVDPLDVRQNRRIYPELIYAANGRAALGNGKYYDAANGDLRGSLGFVTTVYALNQSGNDFWAFDSTSDTLRHFFASDEPLPEGPVAHADHVRIGPGEIVVADVLANDFGFTSPLVVTIATSPSHGAATVTGSPGDASGIRIRYVPAPGFVGSDTLVYTVSDGTHTDSATATIAVDAYRARGDSFVLARSVSNTALFVARNDVGFTGPVTLTITREPTKGYASAGSYSESAQNSYISYSPSYSAPANDYTDTFTYQISDGVHTDTATVSVQLFALKAIDDEITTPVTTPVTLDVAANDIHSAGPAPTVGLFETARHGTVRVIGARMTYTPDPGFLGTDSFIYALDDGIRVSFATVTVDVIRDADGDGVADELDDCVYVSNPNQRDADGDGIGSVCDADLDNDGIVNFKDLAAFRQRFGSADANADFDGNGIVNFEDLERLRRLFLEPPGASASTVVIPEPDPFAAAAAACVVLTLMARLRRRR